MCKQHQVPLWFHGFWEIEQQSFILADSSNELERRIGPQRARSSLSHRLLRLVPLTPLPSVHRRVRISIEREQTHNQTDRGEVSADPHRGAESIAVHLPYGLLLHSIKRLEDLSRCLQFPDLFRG